MNVFRKILCIFLDTDKRRVVVLVCLSENVYNWNIIVTKKKKKTLFWFRTKLIYFNPRHKKNRSCMCNIIYNHITFLVFTTDVLWITY